MQNNNPNALFQNTAYMKHSSILLLLALTLSVNAQVIYKNKAYQIKGNQVKQGKYTGKAISATQIQSNYVPIPPKMEVWNDMNPKEIDRRNWQLKTDISDLPQYHSDNLLDNALYNMALEESRLAIEPDSTFRTGIAWGGVWTRDVSYSIIHALAQLHPEVAMKSLRAKVTPTNRIVQDTGTGGAWPCSTDRTVWAVAAWEVYKVTGSEQWLSYIYPIIRNTLTDDLAIAYDRQTHLMRGETSYMDWREQEYPQWMQPADIYSSEATVNNAVHYMAIRCFADICRLKGYDQEADFWNSQANSIKKGINDNLWLADRNCYSIYLYGRNHAILADQTDAMGNALCILSGIANEERAKRISESLPCEPFGTPCIYPNLKDQYPYHNDATWPFVQGYWMRACAKAGNEQALLHSIGALYRGAALWLSNEENYEITTGDYQLTKLNSPRQLWSVAAQAAIVPHIYYGIRYEADGLRFAPFVPKALAGHRTLKGFRYRQATLDMQLHGFGTQIKSFMIDGRESEPVIPGTLTGTHTIDITLADNVQPAMAMNLCENAYLPITPVAKLHEGTIAWNATEGAQKYEVLCNGKVVAVVSDTCYANVPKGEIAVRGIGADGRQGYISEPVENYIATTSYEAEHYCEMPSDGYVDMTRTKNVCLTIPINIEKEGRYLLRWRYSNGAGPVTTANKCATRLMRIGHRRLAAVFPQRGNNEWDNWGMSNGHIIRLTSGCHLVTLEFTDQTENMNRDFNCVHIDCLDVTQVR